MGRLGHFAGIVNFPSHVEPLGNTPVVFHNQLLNKLIPLRRGTGAGEQSQGRPDWTPADSGAARGKPFLAGN